MPFVGNFVLQHNLIKITEYNGSYGEFLYLVEKGLAQNNNTSSELITRLMNLRKVI